MDYKFPVQLFPQPCYVDGAPGLYSHSNDGGWGSYGQLLETNRAEFQSGVGGETPFLFRPQHKVDGEVWVPTEPIVTPLLPPNRGIELFSGQSVNPDEFPEHMQYFYVQNCMDSFSVMGDLLKKHFSFTTTSRENVVRVTKMKDFLQSLSYKKCELQNPERVSRYQDLLADVIADVPSSLLAKLLHEELIHQKELEHFQPATTGGAIALIPNIECQNEVFLIYPSGVALNSINFHPVELGFGEDKPPVVNIAKEPLVFNLDGTVRQVSVAQVEDEAYVGLRSDYFCASWVMKSGCCPCPLEVVQLKERATSLNVSPHVAGELVVASESGAAYLWTVGKGLQKIREEKENLYFSANSLWRWCEFTAHPQVVVYADRTGAELTDTRSRDRRALFRIRATTACAETVVLGKYLAQSHGFHHLFTTQFSAYIVDERMPGVPALKWEHMMESAPCFSHVVPPSGQNNISKILLGGQRAQETILLQYSGGRQSACQANGPLQKLYSPCESLKIQQLPHRRHKAEERLASHAAGLTATQNNDFLCVLQLTDTGDIFYQMLKHFHPTDSKPHHSDFVMSASNSESTLQPQFSLEEDINFEQERCQRMLSQVDVAVSDCDNTDGPHTLNENQVRIPLVDEINCESVASMHSDKNNLSNEVHPLELSVPKMPSQELKLIWRKWLNSFLGVEGKCHLQHNQIKTSAIQCEVPKGDRLEDDKFQRLKKDQEEILKTKKLLVHGRTYLPPLEVTPVPDGVNPEDWPDDLSQRISASWRDGWSDWWEEKLGVNRDAKIEALRKKRHKEKRTKARVALSSSFTSSVTYQGNLSSQYQGSDVESLYNSLSAPEGDAIFDIETLGKRKVGKQSKESRRNTKESSDATEPIKSLLKSTQKSAKSADKVKATVSSQSPSMDLKQLPSKASTMERNSVLLPQEQGQDVNASGSLMTKRSKSNFPSPSQASWRSSSQTFQPQKKKSRMGF